MKIQNTNKCLHFDDVRILPRWSDVERENVDIKQNFGRNNIMPIISSPMDTITGMEMLVSMKLSGYFGIHHRYCKPDYLIGSLNPEDVVSIGAISSHKDNIDRYIDYGFTQFCIDTAHGGARKSIDTIYHIKSKLPGNKSFVICGSICEINSAIACASAGADVLRLGVSPGGSCSTSDVCGVGLPLLQTILDIAPKIRDEFPEILIVGDGGIRNSGDFCKAIAAGANFVFLGTSLGGTDWANSPLFYKIENEFVEIKNKPYMTFEGAKLYKRVRGMASYSALTEANGKVPSNAMVEGKDSFVEYKGEGSTLKILNQFTMALKQMMFYTGCRTIKELHDRVQFRIV